MFQVVISLECDVCDEGMLHYGRFEEDTYPEDWKLLEYEDWDTALAEADTYPVGEFSTTVICPKCVQALEDLGLLSKRASLFSDLPTLADPEPSTV